MMSTWVVRLVFSIAIAMGMWSHAHAQSVIAQDRQALLDLYNATGGPNWRQQTNWGSANNECTWYGVVCNSNRVSGLYLSDNKLTGTLPSTLSNLNGLWGFYAQNNQLSGAIPSLNDLQALVWFDVSNNQLSGSIPSISNLRSLQDFYVENNQLSGTIPPLGKIKRFKAGRNQLSGAIPALEQSLLTVFAVNHNQLSGTIPSGVGSLNLEYFNASNNQLSGEIPVLFGLSRYQNVVFDVSNNQLSGPVPWAPIHLYLATSSICNNNLISSGSSSRDATWGSEWQACQRPKSTPSAQLRVNVVGTSSAQIDSSTGHGGSGNYALTVTPSSTVQLSAPLSSGSQVFSHWVGCSSKPNTVSTYFNECELLMPASGSKRVTAVYTSPSSKLINISTRAKVLTGDHVLIAGFVISGGPKKVLIKAAGPSMAALNPPVVPNTLSNPMLTLFSGSTPLASNDDWESADNAAAIRASGIAPTHPKEAALLTTLQPGAYTVIVQGVAGGTGIGLVSVDDLDAFDSSSRLINISSRAYTSTGGDDQVIAGFVLQGDPKELFIAGAGPSMTKYGVPGTLTNPFSTLYSQQTILNSNDNWNESADTTRIDTRTVGTMDTPESAIVHTLSQGAYTIIMRGTGTSGIGLISVEE